MISFKGIPVSKGIVIGTVFKYSKRKTLIETYNIEESQISDEINKFSEAKIKANQYLREIKEKATIDLGTRESQIFDAHIYMLNDPVLDETIKDLIKTECINVEAAIQKAVDDISEKFMRLNNHYFEERLKDIQDVADHLLRALTGQQNTLHDLPEDAVVVAEDLTPSETSLLDKDRLSGFVLTQGGLTAHTTIIAKSLMIAAIISVDSKILDRVKHGDTIIIDAISGEVFLDPDIKLLKRYKRKIEIYNRKEEDLLRLRDEESITRDGHKIELAANINTLDEIKAVKQVNGDGIGLLRTEFLFTKAEHLFDEERQFKMYKKVVESMEGKSVVIRVLDIGGDKDLTYFQVPEEINPFLGWRGIRISLERQDIFKIQIRALLRASKFGVLKILLPFISSVEELREAVGIIIEVKNHLEQENIGYDRDIEIGMMIEVPSTAVMADIFAKEVDFFSIGTNDLIQYTLAVDRNNSKIADLYTAFHPSVLRLIKQVAKAANDQGIWVSICGEAAANHLLLPIFVAMGITELSMSSGYILETKKLIRNLDRTNLDYHLEKVMQMGLASEIEGYLKDHFYLEKQKDTVKSSI
ncbi:MAG: phosphoenolpyruvate--protein phosphotransferase [Halanaerobiales bacterium]